MPGAIMRPDSAYFNDLGVVIETLRSRYGIKRVAYVDIDVHHGDGIFFPFEDDPDLIIADIHEDGRYLYPGTGARRNRQGSRARHKPQHRSRPAPAQRVREVWPRVAAHLTSSNGIRGIFQCGATD